MVIYKNCLNRKTKEVYDVVATYMHMSAMPKVKKGDRVTPNTLLGYYGNTGANTTGPHLHIQFDKDTDYPLYCCGLSKTGHNLLKKGTVDSTINPVELFHVGEGQKVTAPSSAWYDRYEFLAIPEIPDEEAPKTEAKKETASQGKTVKKNKGVTIINYY